MKQNLPSPDTCRSSQPAELEDAHSDDLMGSRGWRIGGAAALTLVAAALINHVAARRAEDATPPVGKFIEVDGVRLHYAEQGTGPVVVLLHGNGVTLQDYQVSGVLDAASKQHRVIAFDRPGFGYSTRPRSTVWTPEAQAALLSSALEKMGVSSAVVVGHSWGTLVALAMALNQPSCVSGLVLLSGYYYGTARPDVWLTSAPAVPVIGDALAHTVSPLSGALLAPPAIKASFAPASVSEKFANFPIALTLRPSQIRATAADTAMMVPSAIRLSRRYAELDLPIAVMAGDGDLIAHVDKHAERFAGHVSRTTLHIIEGQGHLFHYAVPEKVAAAILEMTNNSVRASGDRL